jgi:hypothetical protein
VNASRKRFRSRGAESCSAARPRVSDEEVDEIRRHAQSMAHLVVEIAIGHDLHG